jgi:hypothetical protein
VTLTAMDWYAPRLTPAAQPFDIRLVGRSEVKEGSLPGGRPQPVLNGAWNVTVERAGNYRVSLRRWPREADAALGAPLPEYAGVDGKYPAGVALPITKARLKVGAFDQARPVAARDKAAVFHLKLPAGPTSLETWFYDAAGRELCGAFYVEVLRR